MSITILGASGSVGSSALRSVLALDIKVTSVSVNSNTASLINIIKNYSPENALITDELAFNLFVLKHGKRVGNTKILGGSSGLQEIIELESSGIIINALSGLAGLKPTILALKAGKRVATANKESIVMGWHLIKKEIRYPEQLIPVDSEHSAVFQLMRGRNLSSVRRVIITASGGAVYSRSWEELSRVTPADCLKHPVWNMGDKITVDSATLMNKGLEVVEASRLFNMPIENVDVLIHPQSLVHGMIELKDGSIIAHIAPADMVLPVSYAVSFPHTPVLEESKLALKDISNLEFSSPDRKKFPSLDLALAAGKEGGAKTVLLCAADEIAVSCFLKGKIGFNDMPKLVERVLSLDIRGRVDSEEHIVELYERGVSSTKFEMEKL